MGEYKINLTGYGIDDEFMQTVKLDDLIIKKKGDIWNRKTGRKYDENVIRISFPVYYETGYEPEINNIIKKLEENPRIKSLFLKCTHIELQLWATKELEDTLPAIHINNQQIKYFSKINAQIDIAIN